MKNSFHQFSHLFNVNSLHDAWQLSQNIEVMRERGDLKNFCWNFHVARTTKNHALIITKYLRYFSYLAFFAYIVLILQTPPLLLFLYYFTYWLQYHYLFCVIVYRETPSAECERPHELMNQENNCTDTVNDKLGNFSNQAISKRFVIFIFGVFRCVPHQWRTLKFITEFPTFRPISMFNL